MVVLLIIFFIIISISFLGCGGSYDSRRDDTSRHIEWNDGYDDDNWEFPSKHSTKATRHKTPDENVISDTIKQNHTQALEWYKKAADNGNTKAQSYLGEMYEYGTGVNATPSINIRKVEFSAVTPKQILKGHYTIINLVMYEKEARHVVDAIINEMEEPAQESRSGIHNVKDGSSVKVVLVSPDITIDDNEETGIWQGNHLNFSFAVFLPEEYKKSQILFTASVYVNDVIATKLKFITKCSSPSEQKIIISREDIFSAFISYASQDRNRVAAIIQGMKKARPDMDVFFDVESLRSGEDWEKALYREIERRDVLFLCWSHFARESKWVNAEWRYALQHKGAECIEPVPIESPSICPPPEELRHKHFNDKLLYVINS